MLDDLRNLFLEYSNKLTRKFAEENWRNWLIKEQNTKELTQKLMKKIIVFGILKQKCECQALKIQLFKKTYPSGLIPQITPT